VCPKNFHPRTRRDETKGKTQERWKEEVERDLQVQGVRRWRELVTDREKWKDIVRQAKVVCSANGRRRSSRPAKQQIVHLLYSANFHCCVGKMPSLTLSGATSSYHISLRPILISCYRRRLYLHRDFFPLIIFQPKLNMQLSFLVCIVLHGSCKFL
jgi:hypothetical protein